MSVYVDIAPKSKNLAKAYLNIARQFLAAYLQIHKMLTFALRKTPRPKYQTRLTPGPAQP